MTAMELAEQGLSAIQRRLQDRIVDGSLVLHGDATGIDRLDTFFAAQTAGTLKLRDPQFDPPGTAEPSKKLTVKGDVSLVWPLGGLGGDMASTSVTLTFSQEENGKPVDGAFETDGKVTVDGVAIIFKGRLADDGTLLFQLKTPGDNLKLAVVCKFAIGSRFAGFSLAGVPVEIDVPVQKVDVSLDFVRGGTATCHVATATKMDWQWQLVSNGLTLNGLSMDLAAGRTLSRSKLRTSLTASFKGALKVGASTCDVVVPLTDGPLLRMAVHAADDSRPTLGDLAALFPGVQDIADALQSLPLPILSLDAIEIGFDSRRRRLAYAGIQATVSGTVNGKTLDFHTSVFLPPLSIGGALSPKTPVALRDLIAHFLDSDAAEGFPDIRASAIAFDTVPSERGFGLSITVDGGFAIGPMTVNAVTLEIAKRGTEKSGWMIGTLAVAGIDVLLSGGYATGKGWTFAGTTGYGEDISVGKLIGDLAGLFGIECPEALTEFKLRDIAVSAETASRKFGFVCGGGFPIGPDGRDLDFHVTVELAKPQTTWNATFSGTFFIDSTEFVVTFSNERGSKVITASLKGNNPLGLLKAAEIFGIDLSDVPQELVPLILNQAKFSYDFTKKRLVLTASAELLAKKVELTFVRLPHQGRQIYVVVVRMALDVYVSDLPVVGAAIGGIVKVGLSKGSLIVGSNALTAAQIKALNDAIADAQSKVPPMDDPARVVLSADLVLGDKPAKPLQLAFGKRRSGSARAPGESTQPVLPGQSAARGKWVGFQKSVGPINVRRLAVTYGDSKVWLLVDGGMVVGGCLDIDLLGAGIGVKPPVQDAGLKLAPALDGLAVSFRKGPVTLAGGLRRVGREDNAIQYDGQLTLAIPRFEISVMGSYASLKNHPSLFAYGVLGLPVGGPPFLSLDALAAGFGFNRDLMIPGLDELAEFPLIAAVRGRSPFQDKTPAQALEVMERYVPPVPGSYWLAAGLRISSFELVKAFAMATLKFGPEFEVALLGMGEIQVPPRSPYPLGYAALLIKASFNPTRGTLFLGAQLTADSFILSSDCRLTGGFAVAIWFKDDPETGAKAGDFTITLGGFHSAFDKPNYYPDIPRLGFDWKIGNALTLKGGIYFALTPSAVMAGGNFEVLFQIAIVRAWFNVGVDFLLCWEPFSYQFKAGIVLGASVNMNVGFTTISIGVNVSTMVEFWGPPFGGLLEADLTVISITIEFGTGRPKAVKSITWDDFKAKFLPGGSGTNTRGPSDSVCLTRVSGGMTKDLTAVKGSGIHWVLDPERLDLTTWSAVPSKKIRYECFGPAYEFSAPNSGFGVGPVNVADTDFDSVQTVTIVKLNGALGPHDMQVDVAAVTANLPAATWSQAAAMDPSISRLNSDSRTINGALTGLRISAKRIKSVETPPVSLGQLRHDQNLAPRSFAWSRPRISTTTGHDADNGNTEAAVAKRMGIFQAQLAASAAAAKRAAILAVLKEQDLPVRTDVDVQRLSASAATILNSPPVLSVLGAEPQSQFAAGRIPA